MFLIQISSEFKLILILNIIFNALFKVILLLLESSRSLSDRIIINLDLGQSKSEGS